MTTATISKVRGTIGRATIDRISATQSETGREYWNVSVYERRQGGWSNIGAVVSFAATKAEARAAAVNAGLGEVPFLGSPECCLDGEVRGAGHAKQTTGYAE